MSEIDEEKDTEPSMPEHFTGISQNYYSVSLGPDLGFTYITSIDWDADALDSFMRTSCDIVLQAHRHKLLIDALSNGSMVKAENLLKYHTNSKPADFKRDVDRDDQDPEGYQ